MKSSAWQRTVRSDRYTIHDAAAGRFTVSETVLGIGRSTRGHAHEADEVYVFLSGFGKMTVGEGTLDVAGDAVVYVGPNEYHRVEAIGLRELRFLAFFEGEPQRPEVTDGER